jgi:NADPH-dependent 2,4-dienoyl-CoA reductase/sulfur reductase-like enzyme
MRIEHWTHAVEQADAVAARMLEGEGVAPFAPVPYFWSDQYDVKIQFAGVIGPDDEVVVLEHQPQDQKLCALYARAGRLVGVLAIGRPAQLIKYRRMIAQGATLQSALSAD